MGVLSAFGGCDRFASEPRPPGEYAHYATIVGADTTVREHARRTRDSLVGELYLRHSARDSARVVYRASLDLEERVREMELTIWPLGVGSDQPPLRRWVYAVIGDSVYRRGFSGASTTPYMSEAYVTTAMPLFAPSVGQHEAVLRWARGRSGVARRLEFKLLPIASREPPYIVAVRWLDDSARFIHPDGKWQTFAVDSVGRLLGGFSPDGQFRYVRAPARN